MTVARSLAAAVLVAACLDQARAEPLGRLFHSVAERGFLDALRREKPQPQKPEPPLKETEQPPPRLDGYVVRSDGRSTLWVDGKAVTGAR